MDLPIGPQLPTARTLVRPWRPDEADRLYDIVGRGEVTQWLGRPEPWTRAQAAEFIDGNSQTTRVPIRLAIVPAATGVPVGTVMVEQFGNGDPHLGWFLHPDEEGNGWVTEAAAALLRVVVDSGAPRVWAGMWPHNTGSAGVCRRIGMVDLGRQRDPWHGSVEYPLARFFCVWRPDAAHPLDVLARVNAEFTLPHATEEPPIGPDGSAYPGTD